MKYRVMLTVFVEAATMAAAVEAAHVQIKATDETPIGIVQPMRDDLIPLGKPEIVDTMVAQGRPGPGPKMGIHNGRPKDSGSGQRTLREQTGDGMRTNDGGANPRPGPVIQGSRESGPTPVKK